MIAILIVWTLLDVSCPEDLENSQLNEFLYKKKLTELFLSENGQNSRKSIKTSFHKMAVVGAETQFFGKTKVTTFLSIKKRMGILPKTWEK